jgi:ubiquinone/menaquinone biosynthesis C-methylase UbiE
MGVVLVTCMNSKEYENMARVESAHWYYRGKRELVRRWIQRVRTVQPDEVLLDCGAGSGLFAREMAQHCEVTVLDTHEESLQMLREKFRPDQVLTLVDDAIPLPAASVDYVTALDVLEHTPNDQAVVDGFARVVRPHGLAVITVPADMALWSDWDEVLHHYRRYSVAGLSKLFDNPDWQIVAVNYTNVLVYPVVWLARRWRGRKSTDPDAKRAEHAMPPAWLNALLRIQFVSLAMSAIPLPFGVSIVLVARRRG